MASFILKKLTEDPSYLIKTFFVFSLFLMSSWALHFYLNLNDFFSGRLYYLFSYITLSLFTIAFSHALSFVIALHLSLKFKHYSLLSLLLEISPNYLKKTIEEFEKKGFSSSTTNKLFDNQIELLKLIEANSKKNLLLNWTYQPTFREEIISIFLNVLIFIPSLFVIIFLLLYYSH